MMTPPFQLPSTYVSVVCVTFLGKTRRAKLAVWRAYRTYRGLIVNCQAHRKLHQPHLSGCILGQMILHLLDHVGAQAHRQIDVSTGVD